MMWGEKLSQGITVTFDKLHLAKPKELQELFSTFTGAVDHFDVMGKKVLSDIYSTVAIAVSEQIKLNEESDKHD